MSCIKSLITSKTANVEDHKNNVYLIIYTSMCETGNLNMKYCRNQMSIMA